MSRSGRPSGPSTASPPRRARWLKFSSQPRLGLLFALIGWLITHFDTTFHQQAIEEERTKLERVPALWVLSPRWRAARRS